MNRERREGGWNCHTRRGLEPRLRREAWHLQVWEPYRFPGRTVGPALRCACCFPSGTWECQAHPRHAQLPQAAVCVPENFTSPNRQQAQRGVGTELASTWGNSLSKLELRKPYNAPIPLLSVHAYVDQEMHTGGNTAALLPTTKARNSSDVC